MKPKGKYFHQQHQFYLFPCTSQFRPYPLLHSTPSSIAPASSVAIRNVEAAADAEPESQRDIKIQRAQGVGRRENIREEPGLDIRPC